MKTLLVTLEFPPFKGGVANYYDNLVNFWPEAGQITVWDDQQHELLSEKMPAFKWLPAVWRLRKKIITEKIEQVIVGQLLPIGTVAYFAHKLCSFKYTVVIHGMDFTFALKQPRKKKLAKKILTNASSIICSNNYVANLVREFLGKELAVKVHVVNPGVNPTGLLHVDAGRVEDLKKKLHLENKFVLLSLGRIVKRKGVDQVILALEHLIERLPNLVYIVAGVGPDEAYVKNYAQSISNYFTSHIKFMGAISDDEKWQLLSLCNCFIMPAREEAGDFEGFGIVYLEAGLAGKPVVAGASGGVADAVEHMVSGLMVEPTDSAQIAEAISMLIDNPELAERLGSQGRDRAAREFAWPDKIKQFYEIIKN